MAGEGSNQPDKGKSPTDKGKAPADETSNEQSKGPSQQKLTTQARWKTTDVLILIDAKKAEWEQGIFTKKSRADKMKSAETKWKEVQETCLQNGLNRNTGQLRRRWDKLHADWKKIFDYEVAIPSCHGPYNEMGSEERKKKKLPGYFLHKWLEAMNTWLPQVKSINCDPDQIIDTSAGPSTLAAESADLENQENIPPPTAPSEQTTQVADAESDFSPGDIEILTPQTAVPRGGSSAPQSQPRPVSNGSTRSASASDWESMGYKRGKRGRVEDPNPMVKLTAKMIDNMAEEARQRTGYEENYLGFQRQRHSDQMARQDGQLAQAKELQTEVIDALKEVSNSLRFFASEICRRL